MGYAIAEQETTAVYEHETKMWRVYSTVRKHITKLVKSCGEPEWKETEIGSKGAVNIIAAKWTLKANQVRFYKESVMAEEEEDEQEEEDETVEV